jgi:hypothetical protein
MSDLKYGYPRFFTDSLGRLIQILEEWQRRVVTTVNSKLDTTASVANVSNPPTDAELDAEFGTPATVGAGFIAILDDAGAGANVYLVASDGTNWWYEALTKAV